MKWKFKSLIQNAISLFPEKLSYSLYYTMQRNFGALRKGRYSPVSRLVAAVDIWTHIISNGYSGKNKVFFEVGTGRAPITAFANYLMGAKETITVDLNPYIKEELCLEVLDYVSKNKDEIQNIFGEYLIQKNLDEIIEYYLNGEFTLEGFLEISNITYLAPQDAANTALENKSIDYFISYTVFEHIPENVLKAIVLEGNRLLSSNGLQLHKIDYSDHFSHTDRTITAINFLKYSDNAWAKYAGNQYMYMNRLRHDDFRRLFLDSKCKIISEIQEKDKRAKDSLEKNLLTLDEKFENKNIDVLSTTSAWFVLGQF